MLIKGIKAASKNNWLFYLNFIIFLTQKLEKVLSYCIALFHSVFLVYFLRFGIIVK